MKHRLIATTILASALVFPAAAHAATATATTNLNVRQGPGPQYQVTGVLNANQSTEVLGCVEGGSWCQVDGNGGQGWVYSAYLTYDVNGERVVVPQANTVETPIVTYNNDNTGGTVAGAATGAIVGSLIAGPVGAVVGGVIGGATGNQITPPQQVVTYVRDNQVDPVYLDGEVVIGARVPDNVTIYEVPDYEYRYAYVNGVPVLIEPGNQQIVYIIR